MKVLHVVSSAYRATVEEQDDTVLWFTLAMRKAQADVDVLLRGPAVNYAIEGQEAAPVSIGGRQQKHAPDVHGQVAALIAGGARVYALADDLAMRGLKRAPRLAQVELLNSDRIAEFFGRYDRVWHW